MLKVIILALLAVAVFGPALVLSKNEDRLQWKVRYLLAAFPAAYTGIGWRLAVFAYDIVGCQGGMKNIHGCSVGNIDITPLVGHGFFLMIPFFFIALPLSLWLLLNTAAKQIGAWHKSQQIDD